MIHRFLSPSLHQQQSIISLDFTALWKLLSHKKMLQLIYCVYVKNFYLPVQHVILCLSLSSHHSLHYFGTTIFSSIQIQHLYVIYVICHRHHTALIFEERREREKGCHQINGCWRRNPLLKVSNVCEIAAFHLENMTNFM